MSSNANAVDGVVSRCSDNETPEVWKDIPGFSKYEASSEGRIRHKRTGKITKPIEVVTSKGTYIRSSALSDCGKVRSKEVHHLVCLAFHGPPPDDGREYEVNHEDGDKHNNRPYNLEWMTRSENLKHAYQEGFRSENRVVRIHDHSHDRIEEIYSMAELARRMNVSKSAVWKLITDHRKKRYLGRYTFEFADPTGVKPANKANVKTVAAFDYRSNKMMLADDLGTLELLTGIKRGTIAWHLKRDSTALVKGFVFRYWGSDVKWPKYTLDEAQASMRTKGGKGHPVRVTDTRSNTTEVYSSIADFARVIGVNHPNTVRRSVLKNGGRFEHYLIETLSNSSPNE